MNKNIEDTWRAHVERMAHFTAAMFVKLVSAYEAKYGKEAKKIANQIMYDIGATTMEKYVNLYKVIGLHEMVKMYFTKLLPPIWKHEIIESSSERIVARCLRCPYADTWKKMKAEDIGVLFCDIDYGALSLLTKAKVIRTKSLLKGDPYCEYVIEIQKE
ncbi:MAG: L-2-amino-thiazoline-4-carboxylic acid hydrolase [Candidatus Thermoplasmatota archaeon]|nr:L-2-amino-thiazoline-4-carboxylic acid hydrolase [Candidatus Thermoplasmatota archaeon]MBU4256263.1 L-2-amino-thiazoline-4-carboxylic acid hydrolase [Candidatus Thermoplasmatota archaeon]MCG2825679.1 L-2-amino-thiazoline-4-carboxylic acid hydrolase [Thermoplasmatales archaeon]